MYMCTVQCKSIPVMSSKCCKINIGWFFIWHLAPKKYTEWVLPLYYCVNLVRITFGVLVKNVKGIFNLVFLIICKLILGLGCFLFLMSGLQGFIQVMFVEPYFEEWELKEQVTAFDKGHNISECSSPPPPLPRSPCLPLFLLSLPPLPPPTAAAAAAAAAAFWSFISFLFLFTIFFSSTERFVYSSPYTPSGKARGEFQEQYMRKTILTTK